jgi:hypothetical protein
MFLVIRMTISDVLERRLELHQPSLLHPRGMGLVRFAGQVKNACEF